MKVSDDSGVIADISAVLKEHNVSIESMIQPSPSMGERKASVVMITHDISYQAILEVIHKLENLSSVVEKPKYLRIEDL